jgi:hypothetical protein
MIINYVFSAHDSNLQLQEVAICKHLEKITVQCNNEIRKIYDCTIFKKVLLDYQSNELTGIGYKERSLIKDISHINDSDTIIDLFRSMGIIDYYLHYTEDFGSDNSTINYIEETFSNYLFHSSLIDWSGDTGVQPVIYFIKKEHLDNDKDRIIALFNMGLLYKLNITYMTKSLENYYIPFDIPNFDTFTLGNLKPLWNCLIKDMEVELSKLNRK